ncbi:MAG: hypothetical protein WDN69_33360 [Aliidongia sp.]
MALAPKLKAATAKAVTEFEELGAVRFGRITTPEFCGVTAAAMISAVGAAAKVRSAVLMPE